MNEGIQAMRDGLQAVLDQAEEIAPPENTIPDQRELAAQAKTAEPMMAGHRQGKCYVEARLVEDGYAYRLAGSPPASPWQWMRTADFEHHFEAFLPMYAEQIAQLEGKLDAFRQALLVAQRAMGKRSNRRYQERMSKLIAKSKKELDQQQSA